MPENQWLLDGDFIGEPSRGRRKKPPLKQNNDDDQQLFDWSSWSTKLPPLKEHSVAKLDVLRHYIEDYITILCTGHLGMDRFRLTLVDGFAGGGVYEDGKLGSPFVLLEAVKVATFKLNQNRAKPLIIDCHFYFVEENAAAAACLEYQLRDRGYFAEIGKTIFLFKGTFDDAYPKIVAASHQRFNRGGSRVIFFLDQCGYSKAPPSTLRAISEKLNWKAEFIVNIAIDWLTAYANSESTFRNIYSSLGVEDVLPVEQVVRAMQSHHAPQYVVEALVGPAFQKVSGSPFFSPFYILSPTSNRGYWLVHLAPQSRARTAMLEVYWRIANGCRHFGNTGLDMLAYKPDADPSGYLEGMEFGESTQESVQSRLVADLAKEIRDRHSDGITYRQFRETICNRTMATDEMLQAVLVRIMLAGEIDVFGEGGGSKKVDHINPDDIIKPGSCPFLFPRESRDVKRKA